MNINRIVLTVPTLLAAAMLLAACAARPADDNDIGPGVPSAAKPEGTGGGEVPQELLAAIVGDLAEKTGAERSAVEVLRAEAATWRDSSLGCPEPGMMYLQALTDGYWVVLRYRGEEHDYRASRGGGFILCTRSGRQQPI